MAIPLPDQSSTPAGDFVNRQVLGQVPVDLLTGIAGAMYDAGWSRTHLGAANWLTTTGQPGDGNTCTIDGVTYTFKAAINNANPREVRIGASWQETLQAFVHAVNDDGVGKGTAYSSATTAHATARASYRESDGVVFVSTLAAGPSVNALSVSESMANSSWSGSCSGGIRLLSATSTDGHKVGLDLRPGAGVVYLCFGDGHQLPASSAQYDGTRWSTFNSSSGILTATGRYFRIIASKYSVWASVPGTTAQGTAFASTLVKLPDSRMVAPLVSDATGGGGSLVTVTQAGHGMVGTGNVYIQGAEGLAIDGFWNVTVVDENSYTLDGSQSVPAGTYVANSARAANQAVGQISQAYCAWCSRNSWGGTSGWRVGLGCLSIGNAQGCNQYGWTATDASGNGQARILYQSSLQWFDARYWIQEAPLFMGQDQSSSGQGVGWLWGAFLLGKSVPLDTEATDSEGQRWFAYASETGYTLMLAIPPAEN
jgi:hypothetical protein